MKKQIAIAVCLTGLVSAFAQDVTDPDAIPEVRTHWTADESAKTLTDGNFTLTFQWVNQSASPKTIALKKPTKNPSTMQTFDSRTIEIDTNLRVVGINDNFSDKNIGEFWFADTVSNLQYFNCNTATNHIVLPPSLTYIYQQNLKNAKYTGELVIPSKVTGIESYAFENLPITGIVLTNATSLTWVGQYVCKNCMCLTNQTLVLPPSLVTIDDQAFCSTDRLDANNQLLPFFTGTLKIPGSVQTIGADAFCNNGFTSIDFSEATNLTSVGSTAFGCSLSYQHRQLLPNGPLAGDIDMRKTKITVVPSWLFKQCALVTSLELPDTVTAINEKLFNETSARLTNLVLSASLETIADNPFNGWANKATRGTTAIYWRNCPTTIGANLFTGSPDGNSITNYLPTRYRTEWKAYAASVGSSVLTLPADDNSTVGSWTSGRKMAVAWYKAKYPGVGFVIIFR